MSSYIESVGSAQTVENGEKIVFDIDEQVLDIVGADIELDASGTVFTIKRTGLYHVEWSLNLESAVQPVMIGLMEDGAAASVLHNNTLTGNYSSGALINVEKVPFTVSLQNFGGQIVISDPSGIGDTAASIRILRFADGPTS